MLVSSGVYPKTVNPPQGQLSPSRRVQQESFNISNQNPQPVSAVPGQRSSHFIDWLGCILPVLFFITLLVCSAYILHARVDNFKPEGAHNTLETLKENLKLAPIEDVKNPVAAAAPAAPAAGGAAAGGHSLHHHFTNHLEETCPTGYSKVPLGQWDGVKEGCICENGDTSKSLDECASHSTCKKVSTVDPIQFFKWKDGKSLCAKRVAKWKWEPVTCSESTMSKRCGSICLPTGTTTCPLSGLVIDAAGDVLLATDKKFKKKNEDSAPIVSFTTVAGAEANRMCYNSQHNNAFQSGKTYPLAKIPNDGCGEYKHLVQSNVNLLNNKAKDVHHDNAMDDKLTNIAFYNNYLTDADLYQLELVQRIPIKDDVKCKNVHPEKFDQVLEDSQSLYSTQYGLSIAIFVLCLIGLTIAVFGYLMRDRIFGNLDMASISLPKPLVLIALIVAILGIVLGAIFIANVTGDNGLATNTQHLNEFNENECFSNPGIQKAIEEYTEYSTESFSTTFGSILTIFIISIIFFVLIILLVVLQHSKGFKALGNPWRDLTKEYSQYE